MTGRLRVSAAALVAALLAGSAASAQDCASAQDQATLNACSDQAYKNADAALNARYRELSARLKGDGAAHGRLVGAQRAWIAFRDQECAFAAGSVQGGSLYPMVYSDCLAGLTEARTAQLEGYLACEEGDVACPAP